LFSGAKALKELNLSTWIFTNATNYSYMFQNASSLTKLDGIANFYPENCAKNREIAFLFSGCSNLSGESFTGMKDWKLFDTEKKCKITSLASLFNGCQNLEDEHNLFASELEGTFPNVGSIGSMF
jgi:surface protein